MTTLYLVRHGQTDWNITKRYQGQTDIPLNEVGISQARELLNELSGTDFDAIYSSDLTRAVQTAQILAQHFNVPLHKDVRLREIKHGDWEGMYFEDVKTMFAEDFNRGVCDPNAARAPGSETVMQVTRRVVAAVNDILRDHPTGQVIVVSHGLAIATLYCVNQALPLVRVYRYIPDNTQPLVLQVDQPLIINDFQLESLNCK